jgi:hypothetical protein
MVTAIHCDVSEPFQIKAVCHFQDIYRKLVRGLVGISGGAIRVGGAPSIKEAAFAHFLPGCFARPSKAFFGRCPILAGGFHDTHIPPKKVPSDSNDAVLANHLPPRFA